MKSESNSHYFWFYIYCNSYSNLCELLCVSKIEQSGFRFEVYVAMLHISIVGGILVVDPNINFLGFEYVVVLLGLILSFIGVGKIK